MENMQEQQMLDQYDFEFPETKPCKKSGKYRVSRRLRNAIFLWMLVIVVALILIIVVGVTILILTGKYSLLSSTKGEAPNLFESETEQTQPFTEDTSFQAYVWKEGWVRYNGKVYEYNSDIMTFLVMGIDKMTPVEAAKDATDGGQADGLFLVVANPDDKSLKVIAINRDTMVDVFMYGLEQDGVTPVVKAQITVQHGFGDGLEQSCEATVDAVSKLFYDLPISGYAAINMGAIPDLVWAVDGVDLYVLEDMTKLSEDWAEGAYIHLYGRSAYDYVKYRDITTYESARNRLARQKQFLSLYIAKLKECVKQDITLPVQLYNLLKEYMVTDVTMDKAAYLATQFVDYSFDGENIYTLEGTTVTGEEYEEFYPDKDALKELMIEIFYREVTPE